MGLSESIYSIISMNSQPVAEQKYFYFCHIITVLGPSAPMIVFNYDDATIVFKKYIICLQGLESIFLLHFSPHFKVMIGTIKKLNKKLT